MYGYIIPYKAKKVIHNNARQNLGFPFVFFLLQASDLQVDMVELLCGVELLVLRRSIVEKGGVPLAAHFLLKEKKQDMALLN